MNRMISAVCCVALCSMPALCKEKKAAAAATPAMTDQQFVDFAAQTDMVEANLGQLAGSQASAQPVKDYGQMLTTDHTKDFHELYFTAHQSNLNVPSAIDAEHNKTMIDPFQKLKGDAFDQRYVREMIAGHTKAIAIYTKKGAETQNGVLKTYAESALPVLQKHLDSARALEKHK